MDFKLDENLPLECARILREAGHDAATVLEQKLQGAKDSNVLEVCVGEGRALVTLDQDFADIRVYPPDQHAGIIVLAARSQDRHHVTAVLQQAVELLGGERLRGRLWIVQEHRVRIRGE